jgi:exodeoxyribonuclease-3
MHLYSWNINGLRAALARKSLDWVRQAAPDVVCLQETRMSSSVLSEAVQHLYGYPGYWAMADRAGYSGVATFCREPVVHWSAGMGIPRFDVEGRVLITDLGPFDLYNVYFPNGKASRERLAYKLDFYAAFLDHIDARAKAGRRIVFCGDVNTAHQFIDLAHPRANEKFSGFLPEERGWLDRWIAHGWVDAYRYLHPDVREAYTWWSTRTNARARNVGWRLDYFFVHESLLDRVKAAGMCPDLMGSDHCPIWLEFDG